MALSSITVAGITADLNIIGAYQAFVFPNTMNSCVLRTKNTFVPTVSNDSVTSWEIRNSNLHGYRWIHTTTSAGTYGNLAFQSFLNSAPSPTDIFATGEGGIFTFYLPVTMSQAMNMGGFKITNGATPTVSSDFATKGYVDTKPYINIIMASNATTTTVATPGTYVKVAGTTTLVAATSFTSPSSNRITYTGTDTINAAVHVSLSFTDSGTTGYETFTLYKNGSIASSTTAPISAKSGGDERSIPISTVVSLATNDYLEVFVTGSTGTPVVTVTDMNFIAAKL